MKKQITLLCLCLGMAFNLSAQFPGFGGNQGPKVKGKITGQLVDSLTQEAVPYATIVLKKAGKSKEINGILSDDNGKFKLSNIATG